MQEIEHRGCKIQAKSYKSDKTGKWVPHAVIFSETNKEIPMTWEREFKTEREANDFALDGCQFYISENM